MSSAKRSGASAAGASDESPSPTQTARIGPQHPSVALLAGSAEISAVVGNARVPVTS